MWRIHRVVHAPLCASLVSAKAWCSQKSTRKVPSLNNVSLVGVIHDIQQGYVFEDAVCQFTLTTTNLENGVVDSGNADSALTECVVEKDHHTIRCFGDVFSNEMKHKLKEGDVVCVSGRLRLNPQLDSAKNKYYYFPFVHVQPPHGQVSRLYSNRQTPPQPTEDGNTVK
ncbi:MP18 RNA editing complex protein [Angomonas deanei]|uniref:Single-strand binding protein family, putative n=1 Tax=Angomonas deanei TaxID=59799 RepID=A0A7G2C835_9TRYP|nr:MP18 RNA editing complex protein [Angomonas deanei]CAD2214152.1 Single-strand binding protein family, putative [Angomonas deanei]|eukprot:EPY17863.1 MP18 RNA editing complex protein [Angomonas deanei]